MPNDDPLAVIDPSDEAEVEYDKLPHATQLPFQTYQHTDPVTGRVTVRIGRRKGVDARAKIRYLDHFTKNGRTASAARFAGVTQAAIDKAMGEDVDFAEAVLDAQEQYRDRVVGHVQKLAFEGTQKTFYNREGEVTAEETQYPVRLIELEAKRVEPGYRDKQNVDLTVKGGVLVAPAALGSVDDWESKFSDKLIDAQANEPKRTADSVSTDEES